MSDQLSQNDPNFVPIKAQYNGDARRFAIDSETSSYAQLCAKLRSVYNLNANDDLVVKWIDEEGDPCTMSTDLEMWEAIRLFKLNKEQVFRVVVTITKPSTGSLLRNTLSLKRRTDSVKNTSATSNSNSSASTSTNGTLEPANLNNPGSSPMRRTDTINRVGGIRRVKVHKVNGHTFRATHFNQPTICSHCRGVIWGLLKQGYQCSACRVVIHKRCHKFISTKCLGLDRGDPETVAIVNVPLIQHEFKVHNYKSPTFCAHCGSMLMGLYHQGVKCQGCSINIHKRCQKRVHQECDPSKKALKKGQSQSSMSPPASPGMLSSGSGSSSVFGGLFSNSSSAKEKEKNRLSTISTTSGGVISNGSNENPKSAKRKQSIDDYNLLKVLGRGSYAKVMMAKRKNDTEGTLFAIKVIKKERIMQDEDIDWVRTEKHVFQNADHPFLVRLYECFQTEARLFFVMEYVNGGDLMFHMQRERRLPENYARFYAAEISLALHFLHGRGIIYRDLKLDNVLLSSDGHVKLADYGMCKEGVKYGQSTGTFCGTPNYIAPEILKEMDYGHSVDWWALGVLLFEMMVGRSPFEAKSEDELFEAILEDEVFIPNSLSRDAHTIIKAFLVKDPLTRLGCRGEAGLQDIKKHAFFVSVEWDKLLSREATPPFKPELVSLMDTSNFDQEFTNEAVRFTPDDPSALETVDQGEFEGFSYTNEILLFGEEHEA